MSTVRFLVITGMILAAAAWRLLPHTWNLAPMGALALFAGACLSSRWAALLVPLSAMALSDLALYFTKGYPADPAVYLSFAMIVGIGFWLHSRRRLLPIVAAALASSILFFVVTNFAVWLTGGGLSRPKTLEGLLLCYGDAIPFFRPTLVGDALFTTVMFGGFALLEYFLPALREPTLAPAGQESPVIEPKENITSDR